MSRRREGKSRSEWLSRPSEDSPKSETRLVEVAERPLGSEEILEESSSGSPEDRASHSVTAYLNRLRDNIPRKIPVADDGYYNVCLSRDFRCSLGEEDLNVLRYNIAFPGAVKLILPGKDDRPDQDREGLIALWYDSFSFGFRYPPHAYVCWIAERLPIRFSQLSPQGLRCMYLFLSAARLDKEDGEKISLSALRRFLQFQSQPNCPGFYQFKSTGRLPSRGDLPVNWKSRWFWATRVWHFEGSGPWIKPSSRQITVFNKAMWGITHNTVEACDELCKRVLERLDQAHKEKLDLLAPDLLMNLKLCPGPPAG